MYSYNKSKSLLNRNMTYAELYLLHKEVMKMMIDKRGLIPYIPQKQDDGSLKLVLAWDTFNSFNSSKQKFVKFVNTGVSKENISKEIVYDVSTLNTIYASKKIPEEFLQLKPLEKEEKGEKREKRNISNENINKIEIHSIFWLINSRSDSSSLINEITNLFTASTNNQNFYMKK